MCTVDWSVSYGFSPRQCVDASRERVENLLSRSGIDCALMHNLEGLWYDPLSGNDALFADFRSSPHIPVCTVNPLEGEQRCMQVLEKAWVTGARIWRLYPQEQAWSISHPVSKMICGWLYEHACCLLIDAPVADIDRVLDMTEDAMAVIASLHFYDSADWSVRFRQSSSLYITTRLLHGPGTIEYVYPWFKHHLVFASGAPFGAIKSSMNLLDDLKYPEAKEQVLTGNSVRLLGRIFHDR